MADAATLTKVSERAGPSRPLAGGRLRRKVQRNVSAHGFLIGAVLCFAFFSWFPIAREIVMSFQKTSLGVTTWAGWANVSTGPKTRYSDPSPLRCCGPRRWPWRSSAGVAPRAGTFANGSMWLENSKRFARWPAMPMSIPPMSFRNWWTPPAVASKPRPLAIR